MQTTYKRIDARFAMQVVMSLTVLALLCSVPQLVNAQNFRPSISADASLKGFFLTNLGGVQIIMPDSGKSKNILLPLNAEDNLAEKIKQLKKILGCTTAVNLTKLVPENDYEENLVKQLPDLQLYSINKLLPPAISERFNRKLDFGGPNCFFTALSVTDGIDKNEVRHLSLKEFKARLALLYTEIAADTPQSGDVLLYNSGDHGAVYLGGDKVFHKKDLNKEYYFRIPNKLEVFFIDPGEWVPGPNYCGAYARPHDTAVRKIQIFRRNQTRLATWNSSIKDLPEFKLIALMKNTAMQTAPAWKLGKVMGYWSEILSEELVRNFEHLNATEPGKQLMSELESVRDQIFISIEDNYFSSPYANEKIIKEIWFYDNDYSREVIRTIRDYHHLATSEEDMSRILAAIKAINGEPRKKSLLAVIRS